MEELINGLMSKVGLDKGMAEKVVAYLKENAANLPQMLSSGGGDIAKNLAGKLPGGLGGMFGGGDK